ncbi:hypothetical protein CW713_04675 [Methanophagales archaeon]|nr:MAG: hypothetical protein CW713_04675 [Methanophagales archaeon]
MQERGEREAKDFVPMIFKKNPIVINIKTKSSVCPNSLPFATDSPSRIRPIGLSIRSGRSTPNAMNKLIFVEE